MSEWIKFDKENRKTWPTVNSNYQYKEKSYVLTIMKPSAFYSETQFIVACLMGDVNNKFWWETTFVNIYDLNNITHWQPLPAPPKEDKQ